MRASNLGMFTIRQRIERIDERTKQSILPPIDDMYRTQRTEPELINEFVETMTTSHYPGCKIFSASALRANLQNKHNIEGLRNSGVVGSILEGFRRIDLKIDYKTEHTRHLVESLHILLKPDEEDQFISEQTLTRFISHPLGTKTVIRLIKGCQYRLQMLAFEILEWILAMPGATGSDELIKHHIMKILLTPTFLFKKTTYIDVRHKACKMMSSLAPLVPMEFNAKLMNDLLVDKDTGSRRVDGYMEMQLLSCFLCFMSWRERTKAGYLPFTMTIINHLISEVISETFESLEHMQQIMRIVVILSRDKKHAEYMWTHRLDATLQYLVKTDFSLFRKKSTNQQSSEKAEFEKLKKLKSKQPKRKSILDTGERTPATLMFLDLVKPDSSTQSRNEEINYFCTRYVVILYENIMDLKLEIVHDLVSCGVLAALLFRVGKGQERNNRYNALIVHLIYRILLRVVRKQDHRGDILGLMQANSFKKCKHYMPRGLKYEVEPLPEDAVGGDSRNPSRPQSRGAGPLPGFTPTGSRPGTSDDKHLLTDVENESKSNDSSPQGSPLIIKTTDLEKSNPSSPKLGTGLTPGPGFRKKIDFRTVEKKENDRADASAENISDMNASQVSGVSSMSGKSQFQGSQSVVTVLSPIQGSVGIIDEDESLASDPTARSDLKADESMEPPEGLITDLENATMSDMENSQMKVKLLHYRKTLAQSTDLKAISRTMTAQGIIENFYETLRNHTVEDKETIRESIIGISILNFNAYHEIATKEENLLILFQMTRIRPECFFPILSIICYMIQSIEVDSTVIEHLLHTHRVLVLLLRALNMSGWHFQRKDFVYRCFGRLSSCSEFINTLRDNNGIAVLCREVEVRRQQMKGQRRNKIEEDEDGTEILLRILKLDLCSIRIQSMVRAKIAKNKVHTIKAERFMFEKQRQQQELAQKKMLSKKGR